MVECGRHSRRPPADLQSAETVPRSPGNPPCQRIASRPGPPSPLRPARCRVASVHSQSGAPRRTRSISPRRSASSPSSRRAHRVPTPARIDWAEHLNRLDARRLCLSILGSDANAKKWLQDAEWVAEQVHGEGDDDAAEAWTLLVLETSPVSRVVDLAKWTTADVRRRNADLWP
jgi:hypothetical protein